MIEPKRLSVLALTALVLAFALAPPSARALSVGHSGWEWTNPLPQGNSLRDLDFAGAHGYAAGEFGTLLETYDGGASWRSLATGLSEDLIAVKAIDLDSVVVAGGCAVRRSDDAGESFTRLPWTERESPCRSPLAAMSLPAAEVGYLARQDGRVYRSGDAGATWLRMTSVPGTATAGGDDVLTDLVFVEQDTGLAATTAGLYRTADGGVSWTPVAAQAGGFDDMSVDETGRGLAVGNPGATHSTADGGATWTRVDAAGPLGGRRLVAVRCLTGLSVCLAATQSGEVLRSTDGGETWLRVPAPGAVNAVGFTSVARALAVGASGAIAASDDAGASWAGMGARLAGSFSRLSGTGPAQAFAIGSRGALARTRDGRAWTALRVPTDQEVVDVSFADDEAGFALDGAGTLFRTLDGGVTWSPVFAGGDLQPQAVIAPDRDRVLLVGPRGIRRSSDGGLQFVAVRSRAVARSVLFDIDHAGGSLFAYGPKTLLASRDGGRSWRTLERPDHRPLGKVDFVTSRTGFLLGKGGRLWRTDSRARRWRELLGAGTDGLGDIAFSSRANGFATANDLFFAEGDERPDYVLGTSDGGSTFRPQLVSESRHINGIVAAAGSPAVLLAEDDFLFSTITGGQRGERSTLRLSGRRRLSRPGRVVLRGRLSPAEGGERIVVSMRALLPRPHTGESLDWGFRAARADSRGRFRLAWRIRRSAVFVAGWSGDDERAGAGSRPLRSAVRGR